MEARGSAQAPFWRPIQLEREHLWTSLWEREGAHQLELRPQVQHSFLEELRALEFVKADWAAFEATECEYGPEVTSVLGWSKLG